MFCSWNLFWCHILSWILLFMHSRADVSKRQTERERAFPCKVNWSGVAIRYAYYILPPELGCVFLIVKIHNSAELVPFSAIWVFMSFCVYHNYSLWHPGNVKLYILWKVAWDRFLPIQHAKKGTKFFFSFFDRKFGETGSSLCTSPNYRNALNFLRRLLLMLLF
jgi:hypothetical protein